MLRLANPVRHYPWGSTDALPGLLGLPPDGRPHAEIWVGAHPAAPSVVLDLPGRDGAPGTAAPLDVLVRERTPGLLGARVRDRFGDRLPYLVKLLAAVRPLSLQVHPGAERARRRHAEEVAAGVPAAERRYPDPWHKPELLVALAPTLALAGLRGPDEAADLLERLPVHGGEALVDVVAALRAPGPVEDRLRRGLRRVLDLPGAAVRGVTAGLARPGAVGVVDRDPDPYRVAAHLASHAPGDPGVLASLLLHPVLLAPGEALAVAAGVPHCYVAGTGLEVMAASDNVLRAGLTDKLVDVDELIGALAATPTRPRVLRPVPTEPAAGIAVRAYVTGDAEAALAVVDVDVAEPVALLAAAGASDDGPRTVLGLSGAVGIGTRAGRRGVGAGESVLVPDEDGPLTLVGRGTVAVVGVPGDRGQERAPRPTSRGGAA